MYVLPTTLPPHTPAPPVKPILKWAGGKRWLAPLLLPLWRQHHWRRLVEPFCGGLAITMHLQPQQALLNDANPHLINFYQWIQRGLVPGLPMANDRTLYDAYRERFNQMIARGLAGTQEAAELFYYLNRTGYNGLCRFNRQGAFNTPYGRYATIRYSADFLAYRNLFARWTLRAGDFGALTLRPDDFVYADPPYDVEFTQYAQGGFTWADQERLAAWLAQHPGPVVASNQATPRVVALYRRHGFRLVFLAAPRRISCDGDRTPAREVLALKGI
jgi:DNA adenine methylase